MSAIEELIQQVQAAGVILRADPPDLVIKPADRLTPDLEARLRVNKAEILRRLTLEASKRRLEAADVRIAIFISETDAGLRVTNREILTDAEAKQALIDGAVIYTPADMYLYIQLEPGERQMLHAFKKRFGGTIDWKHQRFSG
jgi:hypothetical protein